MNQEEETFGSVLSFYWYDVATNPNSPGSVFFFGKLGDGTSCAVKIERPFRVLFAHVTSADPEAAISELRCVAKERGFGEETRFVAKKRNCVFQEELPRECCSFVKMKTKNWRAAFPSPCKGKNFTDVYGADSGPIERVVLKLRLKGPSWLCVDAGKWSAVVPSQETWTSAEFLVPDESCAWVPDEQPPPPPMRVLAMNVFGDETKQRVVRIEFLPADSYDSVDVLPADKTREEDEKDWLTAAAEQFRILDPDVVVAHKLLSEQFPFLYARAWMCGLSCWTHFGRFRDPLTYSQARLPKLALNEKGSMSLLCGRIVCDTFAIAKEHLKGRTRAHSFELSELVQDEPNPLKASLEIMKRTSALALATELAKCTGYTINGCLNEGKAKRTEYVLLHAFYDLNFVLPSVGGEGRENHKRGRKGKSGGSLYEGGLVLEPKKGVHRMVAQLDFKSLYPSLIRVHKICFTSPPDGGPGSVLPAVVTKIVKMRKAAQEAMKACADDAEETERLNFKQLALKLVANSLYGCLGRPGTRFASRRLAEWITRCGRETLQEAAKVVRERFGLDVVGGVTDAVMIDTKAATLEEAKKVGEAVAAEINALQKSKGFDALEIELQDVLGVAIFFAKTKWAGISAMGGPQRRVVKGLDLVKRDCCELVRRVTDEVLDVVLKASTEHPEEALEVARRIMIEAGEMMDNGGYELEDYRIVQELSKPLDKYGPTNACRHVVAARLLATTKNRLLRRGDAVEFVQTRDKGPVPLELLRECPEKFKLDVEYYKFSVLLPSVVRLFGPLASAETCKKYFEPALRGGSERFSFSAVVPRETILTADFMNCE